MKEKLWTTTFVVNMLLNFIFYLVFYLPTVVIGINGYGTLSRFC